MKISHLLFLLLFYMGSLNAQKFQQTSQGLVTNIRGVDVEVQFYLSSSVRIIKSPADRKYTKESLSVTATPQPVDVTVSQRGNTATLKSKDIPYSGGGGRITRSRQVYFRFTRSCLCRKKYWQLHCNGSCSGSSSSSGLPNQESSQKLGRCQNSGNISKPRS